MESILSKIPFLINFTRKWKKKCKIINKTNKIKNNLTTKKINDSNCIYKSSITKSFPIVTTYVNLLKTKRKKWIEK